MLSEQQLIEKWRKLETDKQQQIAELIESLAAENEPTEPRSLGEELRQIRAEIVASGVPLLDWEGVEREKSDRRGACLLIRERKITGQITHCCR